jgi:F-type H+-transporting ATPase subunit a
VQVSQLLYLQILGFLVQAQVLITSRVVVAILLGSVDIAVQNPQTILNDGQNLFKYVVEFSQDVRKTQNGEEYCSWVPIVGTLYLFVFLTNWLAAPLPWRII